jgi:hypothetical protein
VVSTAPLVAGTMAVVTAIVQEQALDAGREVVVETVSGTYRGLLAQPYSEGTDVKLRCLAHDLWLDRKSVNQVRPADALPRAD